MSCDVHDGNTHLASSGTCLGLFSHVSLPRLPPSGSFQLRAGLWAFARNDRSCYLSTIYFKRGFV